MSTMNIEGWCKTNQNHKPLPLKNIHFHINEKDIINFEEAEEYLQTHEKSYMMIQANMKSLELEMPKGFGKLSDCCYRVYLNRSNNKGYVHLVGHRASDGSLVYSNALLIEQLIN